jgi:RHS repeat-associated protein
MGRGSTATGGNGQDPSANSKPAPSDLASDDTQCSYYASSAPSINAPKGGGALRSIDEKFQANPATGTASLTIPIGVTPGRNGFTPQLSLSYDSGSGNGHFGLGWQLSLPAISRKTSKGVPKYEDHDDGEEDVFLFSGVEDLVPKLAETTGGNSCTLSGAAAQPQSSPSFEEKVRGDFTVRQYIPRTEGSFTRIERWCHRTDLTSIHWRTISKSNVTSIYGLSPKSRITDPASGGRRIFSWLIDMTFDAKGNSSYFQYKQDDDVGVELGRASEMHRSSTARATNQYIKSIFYGNRSPNANLLNGALDLKDLTTLDQWLFEVVFDYGDLAAAGGPPPKPNAPWLLRKDPFSTYNSGFEIRTQRLCRRILMFHHIKEELGLEDYLVQSTDLSYDETAAATYLSKVTQSGYSLDRSRKSGAPITYFQKSYPAIDFAYTKMQLNLENAAKVVDADSVGNLPIGLSGNYNWIDLDGEGKPSVVYAAPDGWYRKANLSTFSSSLYDSASSSSSTPPLSSSSSNSTAVTTPTRSASPTSPELRLGAAELLVPIPNSSLQSTYNFLDLNGNGSTDLMIASGHGDIGMGNGFWERTNEGGWTEFTTFPQFPVVNFKDPNLRYLDLTGDGRADIVISEGGDSFLWYPALGTEGYGPGRRTWTSSSGNDSGGNPRIVFSNELEAIYLADFAGDGLTDLVRIRNGDICYWPNVGYGRFGAKVIMDNSPWMDTVSSFSYDRLRLGDIDGNGCSDLLYFPFDGGLRVWMNQAGNGFSEQAIKIGFPQISNLSTLKVLDLFGSGSMSLVWSTQAPGEENASMVYLDFMGGLKPHLLVRYMKGPLDVRLEYRPSSQYYQDDKLAGIAWPTKLPFAVQCLAKVETMDRISGTFGTCEYTYHHGFYDGIEREFRGFGMVETLEREYFLGVSQDTSYNTQSWFPDEATLSKAFSTPPAKSIKWYYTGAYFEAEKVKEAFGRSYYSDDALKVFGVPVSLQNPILSGDMTPEEARQAWRSLKGSLLREEIYQQEGNTNDIIPFTIIDYSYNTSMLQPSSVLDPINRPGVFLVTPYESLTLQLERQATDHRINHMIALETDAFGNATKSVNITYGRSSEAMKPLTHTADDITVQGTSVVLYTEQDFTNEVETIDAHLVPLPAEVKKFQMYGVAPRDPGVLFTSADFGAQTAPGRFKLKDLPPKGYTDNSDTEGLRLIERKQTRYRSDNLSKVLPPGTLESLAIPSQSFILALTNDIIKAIYQSEKTSPLLPDTTVLSAQDSSGAGYVDLESGGAFWVPSGTQRFSPNPAAAPAEELATARASFFQHVLFTDPFRQSQTVTFDNKFLLPIKVVDAIGNTKTARIDYSNLQSTLVIDENGNQEAFAYDELGACVYRVAAGNPGAKATGDSLDDAKPFQNTDELQALLAKPLAESGSSLGKATSCVFADFATYTPSEAPKQGGSWSPGFQISIQRQTHVADLNTGESSQLQLNVSYFDGRGRAIQTKQLAEPGNDGKERWRVSESNILNKNSDVVRKYLPVYEESHLFSNTTDPMSGATTNFYDALQRQIASLNPDLTWTKTVYGSWGRVVWDEGDTIDLEPLKDTDIRLYFGLLNRAIPVSTCWLSQMSSSKVVADQQAATQSVVYSKTPTETWIDVLGNDYRVILDDGVVDGKFSTRYFFDIQKYRRKVVDSKDRIVSLFDYDMVGTVIHMASMESGQKWHLTDVTGQELFAWDSRKTRQTHAFDILRRPTKLLVKLDADSEFLAEQIIYGESQPGSDKNNLRGKVYQTFDQAAKNTILEYDYAGNPTHVQKVFVKEYKKTVDWGADVAVELEKSVFESKKTFDALQRPDTETRPDGSICRYAYNRQGLLKAVRGTTEAVPDKAFIGDIQYNANNQRLAVVYGNKSVSEMTYDPATFRMTSKKTVRNDNSIIQSLQYTRDCIGNITHIEDTSQQNLFFRGNIVQAVQDFTYDAISRLKTATGREHLGQIGQNQTSIPSSSLSGQAHTSSPTDANSMGNYTEAYVYDPENNILSVMHSLTDKTVPGWTRTFTYAEPSALESTKQSNRLSSTTVGDSTSTYIYDGTPGLNGLMSSMTGFSLLQWDFHNQLSASSTQRVTQPQQTPEIAYYRYDSSGSRVRKVTERFADVGATATKSKDHFYLDGCEIFTKYAGDGTTIKSNIQTTHFLTGEERFVSLEIDNTPTSDSPDSSPTITPLVRYALTNELSSVTLELDDKGQILSQEEYSPYGSTTFYATPTQLKVPKRYRFSRKELDTETGLYYFGTRYLCAWLGRWLSPDPIGIEDGCNVWAYVKGNPVHYVDPDGTVLTLADRGLAVRFRAFAARSHVALYIYAAQAVDDEEKKVSVNEGVGLLMERVAFSTEVYSAYQMNDQNDTDIRDNVEGQYWERLAFLQQVFNTRIAEWTIAGPIAPAAFTQAGTQEALNNLQEYLSLSGLDPIEIETPVVRLDIPIPRVRVLPYVSEGARERIGVGNVPGAMGLGGTLGGILGGAVAATTGLVSIPAGIGIGATMGAIVGGTVASQHRAVNPVVDAAARAERCVIS